jgi:ElaA protein
LSKLNLSWSWKTFDQLSKEELYELLSLRQSIFVVEQKSWYLDADGLDNCSLHLLIKLNDVLLGYLRLLPPKIKYDTPSIGRIAILENYRGNKIGSRLVKEGIQKSLETFSTHSLTISAQEYLIKFYEDHGFKVFGEVYDEDGIPHIQMVKDE